MNVRTISLAKAQLSALVQRAIEGEDIVIGRAGKPVVVLTRYTHDKRDRAPGALKGRIRVAGDFDELPPDVARAFGAVAESPSSYGTRRKGKNA